MKSIDCTVKVSPKQSLFSGKDARNKARAEFLHDTTIIDTIDDQNRAGAKHTRMPMRTTNLGNSLTMAFLDPNA